MTSEKYESYGKPKPLALCGRRLLTKRGFDRKSDLLFVRTLFLSAARVADKCSQRIGNAVANAAFTAQSLTAITSTFTLVFAFTSTIYIVLWALSFLGLLLVLRKGRRGVFRFAIDRDKSIISRSIGILIGVENGLCDFAPVVDVEIEAHGIILFPLVSVGRKVDKNQKEVSDGSTNVGEILFSP